MTEKHLPFFKMLESLETGECPLCFLIKKNIENYCINILEESALDPHFNDKLIASKGFCNYHGYKLLTFNNKIPAVLMYNFLLNNFIKDLTSARQKIFRSKTNCPVCIKIKEYERQYLSALKNYISDIEFFEKFKKSEGLCMPHLQLFIKKPGKMNKEIISFHLEKYKKLSIKTKNFLDAHESSGSKHGKISYDDDILKVIIKTISGVEGVVI